MGKPATLSALTGVSLCCFWPWEWSTSTTTAFLSASRVGDPALDWGGWKLRAESERGYALKSVPVSRSLSRCQFSHPSQGSLLSGSLVPRSWLERVFQHLTKASSSRGCLMSLRLPPPEGLKRRHIGAHRVGLSILTQFSSSQLFPLDIGDLSSFCLSK